MSWVSGSNGYPLRRHRLPRASHGLGEAAPIHLGNSGSLGPWVLGLKSYAILEFPQMGVPPNSNGKSICKYGWFRGTPISGNHHIVVWRLGMPWYTTTSGYFTCIAVYDWCLFRIERCGCLFQRERQRSCFPIKPAVVWFYNDSRLVLTRTDNVGSPWAWTIGLTIYQPFHSPFWGIKCWPIPQTQRPWSGS